MRSNMVTMKRPEASPRNFAAFGWKDPNGRLLELRPGDRHVYRAVAESSYELFVRLRESGDLEKLQVKGLVETDEASFAREGFRAVLRHRRLPFVSYPSEWTLSMLRDAGLLLCELARELAELGLGLQDGHPWNVTFDGPRPVFLDWGSIVSDRKRTQRIWLAEYRKHIVLPLWLASRGLGNLALASLGERRGGAVKTFFQHRWMRALPLPMLFARRRLDRAGFSRVLEQVAGLTARFDVTPDTTVWSDYDQTSYPYKERAFEEFLAGLEAGDSVIDIGANQGHHSLACARASHPVVALDADPGAVARLYERVRKSGESIVPLPVDLLQPTANYGPELAEPEIFDRLRCDHGMALALSHHLVRVGGLPFEVLGRVLSRYVRRSLLVEYIDPSDHHLLLWQKKGWRPPPWYSEAGFVDAFRPHFELAKSWKTEDEDLTQRRIFLFRRR